VVFEPGEEQTPERWWEKLLGLNVNHALRVRSFNLHARILARDEIRSPEWSPQRLPEWFLTIHLPFWGFIWKWPWQEEYTISN
jgi:hypothetical protein